ncbi:hypothetical protein [Megamonas hypermegale]|uniref:hypothetical protein n=1 Tax=Megamonas hypermegale TaxID=158847 RepID=UPI00195B0106|nr:hypothetical protein [Megamonas hypermegale]MBM6760898.1 hypothetical protein [Megamonas hypermegale]
MINIFKIIGNKLKEFFSKKNTDEKILIEIGDINMNTNANIIGERKNLYIPKLNYECEVTLKRKPNNRINPKIRYVTLCKAGKLMKV